MRYLDVKDIKFIATGASLLGSGGGGDHYMGELMAISAIKKYGKVKLLSINEIKDTDKFALVGSIGAPSIGIEKIPNGREFTDAFNSLEKYTNQKFSGTFLAETGGSNSLVPIILGAEKHLPVIDCDTMGRAFPGIQMTTLAINGVHSTPASISDERGNSTIINTINPLWSEKLIRADCVEMGGSCVGSLYMATGKQLKDYGVHNVIDLSEKIGKIVHNVPYTKQDSLKHILNITNGYHLFSGKVIDISNQPRHGFNFGKIILQGIGNYKHQSFYIDYQNENLVAIRNRQVVTVTPDSICLMDDNNLVPSDSEHIKYGQRIIVIGIPCDKKWLTKTGLETVGPKHFGYNFDYMPIKKLAKRGK